MLRTTMLFTKTCTFASHRCRLDTAHQLTHGRREQGEEVCKSEKEALKATITPGAAEASGRWQRKLTAFAVVDEAGQAAGIQRIGLEKCPPCFLTGALPALRSWPYTYLCRASSPVWAPQCTPRASSAAAAPRSARRTAVPVDPSQPVGSCWPPLCVRVLSLNLSPAAPEQNQDFLRVTRCRQYLDTRGTEAATAFWLPRACQSLAVATQSRGGDTPADLPSREGCARHEGVHAGAIYPAATAKGAGKEAGRTVSKPFGPVDGWYASYAAAEPSVHVTTAAAAYVVTKPAPEFRTLFADALEQVTICHALVQLLKAKDGKTMSFESALAALNRAKAIKGYVSVRDAVVLNGPFILHQLPAMQAAVGNGVVLAESPFFVALQAEVCPLSPPAPASVE